VPRERIRVTPNAVEADRFDPTRTTGEALRQELGWEQSVVLGFVGSFARWHRVDFLLEVFARLAPGYPGLRLLLVGDGAQREAIEQMAVDLGVRDRVVFTGRVPHSGIPDHIAAMDVGIMPASNPFGSPMKIFEYMAMGRAAVGPRYIPLEEAIDHGESGLLFPPDDAAALESCLRSLIEDEALRRRLGEAGRRRVLSRHLWEHNAQAVVDLVSAASRPSRNGAEAMAPAPKP
jgi:glycosyltransferase involved in cell wall biosynthesis